MEVWEIKNFIFTCLSCVYLGFLTDLKEEELICLIEECLAVALFLDDISSQRISYALLGRLYQEIHQIRKAIKYYKKELNFAIQMGDKSEEFEAYENLGIAYFLVGNFHEAIKNQEKCLNIAKEMGNRKAEADTCRHLGNAYSSLAKYQEGIEYHEKSLSIAMEIADKELEEMAYCHLGNIYLSFGKHKEAKEFQEKCLAIAIDIGDRRGEGNAYGNLGIISYSLGKYPEAIQYQEMRLAIAIEIGDRRGEESAYVSLGSVYESLGKYHEVIKYQEKCLSIATEIGDTKCEAAAYAVLGNAYKSLGKYQEAMKYHEKSLNIATKMSDKEAEGIAYGNLGTVYQALGKYQEALKLNEKFRCITVEIGDRNREGKAYRNIGDAYFSLGKYQEAIEYHEKFLSIAVEVGDKNGESTAYGKLGNAYEVLGKYSRAKSYYEKHLTIAENIGDRREVKSSYRNLGNVYCKWGNYQKAIEYQEMCLAIAKEIGDESEEGAAYTNLGNTYQLLGKYHEAKQFYEKHLCIAKKLGERAGELAAYANIGNIHRLLGKYQNVTEYYKKSLSIATEIGNRKGEVAGYLGLGIAYHSMGKYHDAIECQEKCLAIAKEIGDRKKEGAAYGGIGNAYQSLENYQEAIKYYKEYLSIAEEIDDADGQGCAHLNIGTCYKELAMQPDSNQPTNMKETESHLNKSMTIYESLFEHLEQDQYKISILDTFIETYRRLVDFYVHTQQMEKALLVSDRGRARALGDLLMLKYSMKTSQRSFIEAANIETILSTCNSDILFYALLRNELASHVLSWVLAHQSPLYFHHSEIEESKSSEKHSEDITKEIGEESITNLVKKSYDKMKVRESANCENRSLGFLDNKDQDIKQDREIGTKEDIKTHTRCIYDEDHNDDENVLELLYDVLVAPVQDKLVQEEIVIIPDGPLYMVPYAAFQDPKTGKFLSETKRIRLAPSLTTLKVLHQSSDDHHQRSGALIIGNPELGRVKFEGSERSFANLPGAETEATEIAKLLGVEPLTGKRATKEAIVHKLQVGESVIHFAAHGSQENGQILLAPSASLATNSIPDEQDYILTMKEAQESGIQAQLVVLSCCHSGRGEIKAEGVVGMSRAFLAAGARAVVASLWAIDDDATKVFMLKFYSHLKRGESASRSLQQAMKDMRETTRYKEPRYWATFFLIGDDVTISI